MPTSWDDPTWTWDKFLGYAEKLTQKRGSRVTRYGYAEMWGWPLTACNVIAAANGGDWFSQPVNPPAGSSNLSDPKIAEAIQWYADLTNVHKVAAGNRTLTTTPGFQLFMTGKASMGIVGHWFYPAFAGTQGLNFDIAPVPIGPNGDQPLAHQHRRHRHQHQRQDEVPRAVLALRQVLGRHAGPDGHREVRPVGAGAARTSASRRPTPSPTARWPTPRSSPTCWHKGYVHSLPISTAWPDSVCPGRTVLQDQIWAGSKTAAAALPGLDKMINADIKKYG